MMADKERMTLEKIDDGLWREVKDPDDGGGAIAFLALGIVFIFFYALIHFGTIIFSILAFLTKGVWKIGSSIAAFLAFVFFLLNLNFEWVEPITSDQSMIWLLVISQLIFLVFAIININKGTNQLAEQSNCKTKSTPSYKGKLLTKMQQEKAKIHKDIYGYQSQIFFYKNTVWEIEKIVKTRYESYTEVLFHAISVENNKKLTFNRQKISALIKKEELVLDTQS